jgi:hypothetical protein
LDRSIEVPFVLPLEAPVRTIVEVAMCGCVSIGLLL